MVRVREVGAFATHKFGNRQGFDEAGIIAELGK